MPRGDRTGPEGMGSMTGRGAGFCSGSGMPGYMNGYAGYGRGLRFGGGFGGGFGRGFGRGAGMGFRFGAYPYAPARPYTPEAEQTDLERQASILEGELNAIRSRLNDLEKQDKE